MQFVTSLHRSDCFRLERQLPGGIRTRWDTAPFHGAHQYRAKVDALLDMGMRVEEHRLADYARAVELQSAYGLLTIDSVILATALRVHADHLVTTDTGFRGIDEFSVGDNRRRGYPEGRPTGSRYPPFPRRPRRSRS